MTAATSSTVRGRSAEHIALSYLQKKGLKLLERNFRTPYGEIDLVMNDGDATVFIEVRSRSKNSFLDTIETIDRKKCMRIISSSKFYLQKNNACSNEKFRFDVVALTGPLESARLEWIQNAFEA